MARSIELSIARSPKRTALHPIYSVVGPVSHWPLMGTGAVFWHHGQQGHKSLIFAAPSASAHSPRQAPRLSPGTTKNTSTSRTMRCRVATRDTCYSYTSITLFKPSCACACSSFLLGILLGMLWPLFERRCRASSLGCSGARSGDSLGDLALAACLFRCRLACLGRRPEIRPKIEFSGRGGNHRCPAHLRF